MMHIEVAALNQGIRGKWELLGLNVDSSGDK